MLYSNYKETLYISDSKEKITYFEINLFKNFTKRKLSFLYTCINDDLFYVQSIHRYN